MNLDSDKENITDLSSQKISHLKLKSSIFLRIAVARKFKLCPR